MSIRFLIIDDHAEYRDWLGHHLTAEWGEAEIIGHDPAESPPLPEGVSPSSCDLILLDHRWPGGSGMDLLKELKRRPGCPPVILLTPQGDQEAAVDAIRAGAEVGFHFFFPKQAPKNLSTGAIFGQHRTLTIIRLCGVFYS